MDAGAGINDKSDEVGRYLAPLQKVCLPTFDNAPIDIEHSSIRISVLISFSDMSLHSPAWSFPSVQPRKGH